MKKQNGITLIALIITIIVMLILVGVTVNVALNGGLFDAATDAVARTQLELDAEQLRSAVVGAVNLNGKVNFDKLNSNLPEGFTVENGVYTSKSGNKFSVGEDTNISNHKTLEQIVASVNADIAANPDNYSNLDDGEGETQAKISSIFNANNITPPGDMDDNQATIDDQGVVTVRYNVVYNGNKVQVIFKAQYEEVDGTNYMTITSMAVNTIDQIIAEINEDIAANTDDWSDLDDSEGETNAKLNETFNKYSIVVEQDLEDAEINVDGTDLTAIIDASYNGSSIKIKVSAQMISDSAMNVIRFERI